MPLVEKVLCSLPGTRFHSLALVFKQILPNSLWLSILFASLTCFKKWPTDTELSDLNQEKFSMCLLNNDLKSKFSRAAAAPGRNCTWQNSFSKVLVGVEALVHVEFSIP